MATEDACYEPNPDLNQFSQGDVLSGIPFPTWPTFYSAGQREKWAVLRRLKSGKLSSNAPLDQLPAFLEARAQRDVPDAFSSLDQSERVVGVCQKRRVIILSRSCALDNQSRKHLVVAPVSEIRSLREEERGEGKIDAMRAQKMPHIFYLPPVSAMEESFADFLKMTSIHRSFLTKVSEQLVARLSSVGTMALQHQISNHFGTQFGYDQADKCPQKGSIAAPHASTPDGGLSAI
jgi:hypothetical protein